MKKRIGKIYKITSPNTDKIYIGSTFDQPSKRLSKHKMNYNCFLKGMYHYITAFDILKHGDCKLEILDKNIYDNKYDLLIKENHYMELYKNDIVNINKAIKV